MASMNTLPIELIEDICYLLRGRDLKRFRLVNKDINGIAEQCFWDTQTLVINLNREQLAAGMEMLEDLKNRCKTSGLVRAVIIDSLAPQRASRYQQREDYKGFEGIEKSELERVKAACEALPKILAGALSAMKNLRHITWGMNSPDQDTVPGDRELKWTHSAFSELWSLPHLDDMTLGTNCSPAIPFPPLQGLRHLKGFTVKGNWSVSDAIVSSTLSPMIANNPDLITLDLSPWDINNHHRCSFHLLFNDVPEDGPRRKLEHLQLHGWFVTLTPSAIPHLRNLQSLTLRYAHNRYEGIWGVLQREGIHLRDLEMANAGDEVLDYLESFSGLETLAILAPEGISLEESARLSKRFYDDALPKHSKSLYDVRIGAVMDGPFSVGLDNAAVFSTLEYLETLDVCLRGEDLRPGEGTEKDVTAFLVTSLIPLRYFDYLSLHPTFPRHDPFTQFQSIVETKIIREELRLTIVDCLEKFRLPKDRLPEEFKDEIPPFLVSTLTPNGHYLEESEDDSEVLVFVREKRFKANDSFHFIDLKAAPLQDLQDLVFLTLVDGVDGADLNPQ